jgi:hypothetical protein
VDIETPEQIEARNEAHWATLGPDLEALAEQCCDEFSGERGTFQDLRRDYDRNVWRDFAKYLWGLGARPDRRVTDGRKG